MKISVFGLGYVGAVSAACLARDGHEVTGVDVSPFKVDTINAGRAPVMEPGLEELVRASVQAGRLAARGDARSAVLGTDVSLICVGTPSSGNGSLDLQYVENVCRQIGEALAEKRRYHVVVVRSTVLPGTVDDRLIPILQAHSQLLAGEQFGVAMNPEFLREASAIADYDQPSQIVIGQLDDRSGDAVAEMYRAIAAPSVRASLRTAEMVKYVNNAFHAVKVVFANEIGALCKALGVDGREVMEIFCQDRRLNISPAYLRPGFAFGGSCLPKDLRALLHQARRDDVECPLLAAAMRSNQQHVARGIALVEQTGRKRIGVFGLSFKPGTDDVRESPVVPLVETLLGRGFQVRVFDANVQPERLIGANKLFLERELPHIASLMRPSLDEVVDCSDVLVIANGDAAFRQLAAMRRENQVLIDLAGVCRPGQDRNGRHYEGICW